MKKTQSRATKAVLASLLALSLAVPTSFASAQTAVTTTAQSTVEAAVVDGAKVDVGQAMSRFFTSPTLVVQDGKFYVQMTIAEGGNPLIAKVTTERNGEQVDVDVIDGVRESGTRVIQFPVASVNSTTAGKVSVDMPNGEVKVYDLTVNVSQEVVNVVEDAVITTNPERGMAHFEDAKVIEKNGKYFVDMTIIEKSNPLVVKLTTERDGEQVDVDVIDGVRESGTRHIQFPIASPDSSVKAHIEVDIPKMGVIAQDFTFIASTETEEVEELDANIMLAKVFKEDGKSPSYMSTYVEKTAYVAEDDDAYIVEVSLSGKDMIKSLNVDGEDAVVTEEAGDIRTYQFATTDLSNVEAAIHVVVDTAGIKYDTTHNVVFSFVEPFQDMLGTEHEAAVKNLNALGIVVTAEKFNANNSINRGQFALMLARTLGMPETIADQGFKDLTTIQKQDAERYNAINYLASIGVVQKSDKFNPGNTLTRKQGALMIYRAMNHVAGKELNYGANIDGFADQALVTEPEARNAFALLNQGGILTGTKKGDQVYLNPNNPLKRGQMAKILNNSLKYFQMGK